MSETPADRLVDLERRAAFADRTIEELNEAITAQWRVIDALGREVSDLRERVGDMGRREPAFGAEPPPPHY